MGQSTIRHISLYVFIYYVTTLADGALTLCSGSPTSSPPARARKSSWVQWIQTRVPFLRSWNNLCDELGPDALVKHIALLSGTFSTFDAHRTRETAGSIAVMVDAVIQRAIDNVVRRAEPDAAMNLGIRIDRCMAPSPLPNGPLTRGQLPAPRSARCPNRELANTV